MRIDAHQHFWQIGRGDYLWLEDASPVLRRDFLPDDLAALTAPLGIGGSVLVQAAATVAETRFLLSLASEHPTILGVVGWLDVAAEDAPQQLAALAADPRLVGIRPMLQDIAETEFVLQPAVARTLDALSECGLCFDALIRPRHLPVIDRLMRRHPGLRLVIDHGAKPRIDAGDFSGWADGIAAVAAHPGVHCKLSGLVTEAGPRWRREALAPYAAHLRHCFGAERLMWGSDWPVLLLAGSYESWHREALALVPAADHAAVFGGTAARFYRLAGAGV